jgi:hypothetical protein
MHAAAINKERDPAKQRFLRQMITKNDIQLKEHFMYRDLTMEEFSITLLSS